MVTVAGESSITGSLVTDTAKYGLSMSGQAPLSLHVWYCESKVLRCGSPNNPQYRNLGFPWKVHGRWGVTATGIVLLGNFGITLGLGIGGLGCILSGPINAVQLFAVDN